MPPAPTSDGAVLAGEGAAFERQAEGLFRAAGLVEPAHDLGAFAGLRGDEDRSAGDRQRLAKLLGQRQGDGIDAEGPVERLDGAVDGMRAAHADEQQLAGLFQRGGGPCRHWLGRFIGGDRIGMLACHFAIDRGKPGRPGSFCCHDHPLTPPLVSPEIRARCMTRPISTGGRAASTPAVAISP